MAAILAASMLTLSAALNSLASTTVLDLIRPRWALRMKDASDAEWMELSRLATVAWGAVLAGVALLARDLGSVLEAGLFSASVVYRALLGGVFLWLVHTAGRE